MYKMPEKTLQAIANYLARRPYAEVFQLISAIQKLEEIKEVKKVKK